MKDDELSILYIYMNWCPKFHVSVNLLVSSWLRWDALIDFFSILLYVMIKIKTRPPAL